MKHKYRILCIFSTFGRDFKLTAPTLIGEDVIVTLDSESGKPLHSFGKDMFLMPHGLTIDNEGNHYVTDVGLHQVLRVTICQMSVDSLFMPAHIFFSSSRQMQQNRIWCLVTEWSLEKTKLISVCRLQSRWLQTAISLWRMATVTVA